MNGGTKAMAENWVWNKKKLQAAELLASDEFTYVEIKDKIGVAPYTLVKWRQVPEFKRKVEEISKEITASVRKFSIAKKHNRVDALNQRWKGLRAIIMERAEDPAMQDIPGGKTGLVIRQMKQIGQGKWAQTIEEYIIDAALLKEIRAHEEQAARELGQWVDQSSVVFEGVNTNADVDLASMTTEELENLDRIFRAAEARRDKKGSSD